MNQQKTTVILGGNGKTGRRLAARLAALGERARVVSRSTPVRFDWANPNTWERALTGASKLYVSYAPDLAVPGAAEQVRAVTLAAVSLGISRIVLLAGRGEPQVHPAEAAVRDSGAEYTILECAFFNQNFNEGMLAPVEHTIYFPGGNTLEPFVDCDDIADVAAAALADPKHAGQTYDLTGPRLLSFQQVAEELTAAASAIRYEPVSFEEYAEMLAPHLPPPHVEFFVGLFRHLMDGHNAHLGDGVQRALGRPARDFSEYARRAAGAWA